MSRLSSFLSPPASCPLSSSPPPPESGRAPTRRPLAFPSPFSLSCGRGGWSGAVVALGSRRKGGPKKKKKQCFLSVAGGSPVARSLKPCSGCIRALLLCGQAGYRTRAPFWGTPDHFEAKGILTIT